jgi:hypothetical protein
LNVKTTFLAGLCLSVLALTGCSAAARPELTTWSDGACTESNPGVSLSVDYLGDVVTHCAENYEGNGWELFEAAGFKVEGTDKYPTAFACQIDDQPSDAKCDDAPGAYWGYYIATRGIWGYATSGAADRKSTCGTHEGWVYMETEATKLHLPEPSEFTCK